MMLKKSIYPLHRTVPMQICLMIIVVLLTLVSSTFSQTPTKGPKPGSVTSVVSDSVLKTGSKISGGWREYATDWSWRRVVFTLDGQAGTIVFGDGKPGRRLPSVTHYAWSGPGRKGKGSLATYDEARTFADATPAVLDRANQSSPIPSDVARRVREIGGDFRLLQRLMDMSNRMKDVGSAFDAFRRPADDGGFFGDRPGGPPRRSGGGWSDPRRGVGRDGRASDDPFGKVTAPDESETTTVTDRDGTRSTRVVHHGDGSTTTRETRVNSGGVSQSTSERDKNGEETSGSSISYSAENGSVRTETHHYDAKDGMEHWEVKVHLRSGPVRVDAGRGPRTTPSESGSRGGFDEAWMDQSLPWFMDAVYLQWKRESELVKSGGRISQPGGQPTMVLNEGPEVGVNGVVNCGDSNTMPCARTGGVEVDTGGRLRNLSQPGRGVSPGPIDGKAGPRPIPVPSPRPQ